MKDFAIDLYNPQACRVGPRVEKHDIGTITGSKVDDFVTTRG